MNRIKKHCTAVIIMLMMLAALACCGKKQITDDLFKNAVYTEDTTLGTGSRTLTVSVIAGTDTVTFTIKTEKPTVGDALIENGLIDGEKGAYGLYVKVVNGITADYDIDGSYWSFCKNGEIMTTGVDGTNFSDGDGFELVYTK